MPVALNFAELDAPHMTLLFLATVAALTAALVIVIRELERSERARHVRMSLARLIDRSGRLRSSRDKQDR